MRIPVDTPTVLASAGVLVGTSTLIAIAVSEGETRVIPIIVALALVALPVTVFISKAMWKYTEPDHRDDNTVSET